MADTLLNRAKNYQSLTPDELGDLMKELIYAIQMEGEDFRKDRDDNRESWSRFRQAERLINHADQFEQGLPGGVGGPPRARFRMHLDKYLEGRVPKKPHFVEEDKTRKERKEKPRRPNKAKSKGK